MHLRGNRTVWQAAIGVVLLGVLRVQHTQQVGRPDVRIGPSDFLKIDQQILKVHVKQGSSWMRLGVGSRAFPLRRARGLGEIRGLDNRLDRGSRVGTA